MIVVIGLGKSGFSTAKYLIKQGENIHVMDSREDPPCLSEFKKSFPDTPLTLGKLDEKILAKADEIVASPGVDTRTLPVGHAHIIGDMELFARKNKAPVVAITGSNAKSTVTSLVGEMAKSAGIKVAVGGNFGTPVLDLPRSDLYVLELSSFQLETTHSLRLSAATILNVSPDHMDRYDSFDDYVFAKQKVYQFAQNIIFSRADRYTFPQKETNSDYITFGLDAPGPGQFGIRDGYLAFGDRGLLPLTDLKIKGAHNYSNALAALALGNSIRLPMDAMLTALTQFEDLPHRCQLVCEKNKVKWYNDSKATNVGATLAAIKSIGEEIKGKIIWIAGGIAKDANFSPLNDAVSQYVSKAVLFGQDAKLIESSLDNKEAISHADDLQAAVNLAHQNAKPGDAVLFSPACASFDMFKNFEERGEAFMAQLKRIS